MVNPSLFEFKICKTDGFFRQFFLIKAYHSIIRLRVNSERSVTNTGRLLRIKKGGAIPETHYLLKNSLCSRHMYNRNRCNCSLCRQSEYYPVVWR